ncbi:MAG: hypothetical protein HUU35_12320, partial [Armatimonadetes bacterium]|nr:hypothetical protein [Armatimonadota bacterium]
MIIRTVVESEVAPVATRLAREFPGDGFTPANVHQKVFDDPDYTPALNLAAWDGSRPLGALLGTRRGERGYIKALTVAPDA